MDTIVYFGSRLDDLRLDELEGARRGDDGAIEYVTRGRAGLALSRRVVATDDLPRALDLLRRAPVDALVVDARADTHAALRLLELVFPAGRMGAPLLRKRVLALVAAGATETAFALGAHGIGGVLPDPSGPTLAARLDAMLAARGHGKVAICLAGGGIEGLLYELGVLRALDACMADRSVVDLDLFCGISAGAILGALLANGVGPDEILRALDGGSNRLDPIGRWDLFEPNVGELASRLAVLARELARGGAGPRGALSSLLRAVPTAAFSGRRLTAWLERQLERPGMSNRFGELRRPLYVGATDQDTSEAVLFGDEGHAHVPVHRAVRASCALVPFYPPVSVDGRWYVDGAFSRTTNMRVAAQRGATLVILVDPLVPVRRRARLRARARRYLRRRAGPQGADQRPLRQGGGRHRGDAPQRGVPPLSARGRGDADPLGLADEVLLSPRGGGDRVRAHAREDPRVVRAARARPRAARHHAAPPRSRRRAHAEGAAPALRAERHRDRLTAPSLVAGIASAAPRGYRHAR